MGEGKAVLITKCVPATACFLVLSASVPHIKSFNLFQYTCLDLKSLCLPGLWRVLGKGHHPPASGELGSKPLRDSMSTPRVNHTHRRPSLPRSIPSHLLSNRNSSLEVNLKKENTHVPIRSLTAQVPWDKKGVRAHTLHSLDPGL